MDVAYDEDKFAELVLHVAGALREDRAGGAAKLGIALFLVEFTHLRRHHGVVSGCRFEKLANGPSPIELVPVARGLVDSGAAQLVDEDFLGRPQRRLVPRREADVARFTADELATVDDVLAQLTGLTAAQLIELSQHEPGWRLTEVGEVIPPSTAFLGFPQPSTPTSRRLQQSVAQQHGFLPTG